MASYYKHSGKFAPQGPILGLLGGIIVSVPAALLYDYALFTVPYMKLRFVLPIIFGLLLGGVCGGMMCLGKVRSKVLAGIVGFASSSIGLYLSWQIWIRVICVNRHVGCSAGLLRPLEAWKAIVATNLQGTWTFTGGKPTHGVALWFVWAGEALMILVLGAFIAVAAVQSRPFCERCNRWCKRQFRLYIAPELSPEDLKTQLESGQISKLEKLAPANKKQPHYTVELHSCGVCHQLNTLTLSQIVGRNVKTLMNKFLLNDEQVGGLRNIEMNHRAAAGVTALASSSK